MFQCVNKLMLKNMFAGAVAADLQCRETSFQMVGGDPVQLEILLFRTLPHMIIGQVGVIFRLVPDLPAKDIQMQAIGPAFIVMADDMLADHRPLFEILGRIDMADGDIQVIFNGDTQPVNDLHAHLVESCQQPIGVGKVIAGRVIGICVEIGEHIGDIHKPCAAVHTTHIVKPGEGNTGLLHKIET